ncbi:MAG: host attachment protein [Bacillota bacterium]|nr:host attachment protein [Bacillota bacterium]
MELKELQRHIMTLATLEESEAPVVSCYLDLETSGYRTVLSERVHLLRKTFPTAEKRQDFEAAVALIEEYLALGIHRDTNGLALFARGGSQRFFLPLQFHVSVPNWIAVGSLPNIYHLVELKDTYHRFVVMLSAEDSTRILGVNLGAITQEIWDRRPELRQRVGRSWTKDHYQSHVRERTNQFLHEGIQVLEGMMLADGYKHLILAGNPRVTSRIRQALPKQLAAMLVDIVHASAQDAVSDVVRATLLSFIEQEEQESLAFVDRLQEAIHTDGLAVVGARASMQALQARQADVLILAKAYCPDPSWICAACEAMEVETAMPNRCPRCREPELLALDVKETMVRLAEQTGCGVEVVNHSDALMRLGGVGCLLRYLAPDQYHRRAA